MKRIMGFGDRTNFLPAMLTLALAAADNSLGDMETAASGDAPNLPEQEQAVRVERPKDSINWTGLGPEILKHTDWNLAEERDNGRGPYLTTTAHNTSLTIGGYRYQISMSVNRMAAKKDDAGNTLTPAEKRAAKEFGLTDAEALKIKTLKAQSKGVQSKIGDLK